MFTALHRSRMLILAADLLAASAVSTALSATAFAGPPCTEVPVPFLAFAFNGGDRVVKYDGPQPPDYYVTFGLRNLSLPDHLLLESGGYLALSTDQGCSWQVLAQIPSWEEPMVITPGPAGSAYAFTINGSGLYRVFTDGAKYFAAPGASPVSSIMGLGVDPADHLHVRVGDSSGQMHESLDGGLTWRRVGAVPYANAFGYRFAFDPHDLDHAIFGALGEGGYVTFDGGATWNEIGGLSASGSGPVNLFNAIFSPIDGDVAWCMALDIEQSDQGHPSQGRHIYLSTDGGQSFTPVVDNGPDVVITNGPELTAHPTNPARMAWGWGSNFENRTLIHQYDASLDRLKVEEARGILARVVEYYRPDPRHLYVGLEARH